MGLFRSSHPKNSPNPTSKDRVVGIDVGASAMKVVELQDRSGVVTLTTYGELQLGPYLEMPIGHSGVLPPPVERQALVDVLRESAVKAHDAVLAMPLSASFVTVIGLAASKDEELEARVRVEARKYIPVPIADVALDWAEIEAGAGAGEGQRDVLIAAIQNDALLRFSTLMQTAELRNPPTEIECFSTLRSVYREGDEHVALIDIGAQSSKLYIIRNGLLQRMHRVPYAGMAMTERLVTETGEWFEVVEAKKRTVLPSDVHFAPYQKTVQAVLGRVLQEFMQVMTEYEKRTGASVASISLSGSGSLFPMLDRFVASALNRPTSYVQPFDKVAYPAFMEDTLQAIGPSFATALGAALRYFE